MFRTMCTHAIELACILSHSSSHRLRQLTHCRSGGAVCSHCRGWQQRGSPDEARRRCAATWRPACCRGGLTREQRCQCPRTQLQTHSSGLSACEGEGEG